MTAETITLKPEPQTALGELVAAGGEIVPSSEVFATPEDVTSAIAGAISDGTISYDLPAPNDETRSKVFLHVPVEASELNRETLTDEDIRNGFTFRKFEEIMPLEPTAVLEKTKHTIQEAVQHRAELEQQWHLNEENIRDDVENGTVRQYMRLETDEGRAIDIVNFSGTSLSEEQIAQVEAVFAKVIGLSGGSVYDRVRAICIQSPDKFDEKVIGSARSGSGVVRLNELLINGAIDDIEGNSFGDLDATQLQTTLTHELGHLVEQADTSLGADTYGRTTGWRKERNTFVDDYGMVQTKRRDILEDIPYEITIKDKQGVKEVVKTKDMYGLDVMQDSRPSTPYGHTNEREDFAEAYVYFVNDPSKLNPIRRDAIQRIISRGAGDPVGEVHMSQVDLRAGKIGTVFAPSHYVISEPMYFMKSTTQTPDSAVQQDPGDTSRWYGSQEKTFVDDYGNRMTRYDAHSPRE